MNGGVGRLDRPPHVVLDGVEQPGQLARLGRRQLAQRHPHDLVAALGGLDRLPADARARLLQENGVDTASRRTWVRAITAAAGRRERGTVALLAAVGMQTNRWSAMTPENLYYIVSSLRQVGLDSYARMIAAEAMARA